MEKFKSVDAYLSAQPPESRTRLQEIRKIVREEAPAAEEAISYNMPAFKWNGMLLWYAGHSAHIGVYPTPATIAAFRKELSGFVTSKGAIQFPLDKPLPSDLIRRIVQHRVRENGIKSGKGKKPPR